MIPLFKVFMSPDLDKELLDTLHSGYITQGPKVDEFEAKLKAWLGVDHLLTVNSGTSALQLALTLAGVGHGDTVISTPMTCTATNTAIRAVGADIIWADIDPFSGNIDSYWVEQQLFRHESSEQSSRVKAVMVVDWGGLPCDYTQLRHICDSYGVKLIEDAAHAFGATYRGKKVGQIADFTCFSFQAIKHLTSIDGGALVCRDPIAHERGKRLRWFGIDREAKRTDFRCEIDVEEPGYKYHMNDVNAVVGLNNLKHIDDILSRHKANGHFYDAAFKDTPCKIRKPMDRESAYWLYTIHVPDRDKFMQYMKDAGVQTSQVHSRNDTHTMFAQYKRALSGVESFTTSQVNIPVGWWVTPTEREKIADLVKVYIRSYL